MPDHGSDRPFSGEMMNNIQVHLIIEGRVQGVWFRESTRREAVSLRLTGWVKNRPDGTVEALIEGPQQAVDQLVAWCHKGPPAAKVTAVHKEQGTWQGEFDAFDIVF
jgi:acylphosphatase